MPEKALSPYKSEFLQTCISNGVLKFGSYRLKSGRLSPYFFDAGEFYSAEMLHAISTAFAQTIIESDSNSSCPSNYDVIFGPAYKGIPLATATVAKLADLQPTKYQSLCYSFDRKEVKDHGEGGMIVGAPLKDKKILIVDDVVTAGTAKREAIEKIQKQGGTVVGIIVALDRMESLLASSSDNDLKKTSAIGELRKEYSIPVLSILSLNDIIEGLELMSMHHELKKMQEYRALYQASE